MSKDLNFDTRVLPHETPEYSSTPIHLFHLGKRFDFCWEMVFWFSTFHKPSYDIMTSLDIVTEDICNVAEIKLYDLVLGYVYRKSFYERIEQWITDYCFKKLIYQNSNNYFCVHKKNPRKMHGFQLFFFYISTCKIICQRILDFTFH